MGPAQLHSLGLNSSHLLVPDLNLRAANATGITILGAAFISISGISSKGKIWRTNQLVYVAEGLDQLILSKDVMGPPLILTTSPGVGGFREPMRRRWLKVSSSLPKKSCRWMRI